MSRVGYAAPEIPVWLQINGGPRVCWSASPYDIESLVLGWLITEGYLQAPDQLLALELEAVPAGCAGARVTVPEECAERVAQERRHMLTTGCGALHFVHCDPTALRRPRPAPPDRGQLTTAFRQLFTATDAAWPDGGMHAAAVWLDGELSPPVFDVGRHNAVDRAIGSVVRVSDLARSGLVLSSRVSGAMALKAARAGVSFLASRSIPTTLAAQLCECAGLPILARAGRGRASP